MSKYLAMSEQTDGHDRHECDFISAEHLICTKLVLKQ